MRERGNKFALLTRNDGDVIGAICMRRLVSLKARRKVEVSEGQPTIARLTKDYPPPKIPAPTRRNVLIRDNFMCQYSGQKLTRATASIDHFIPVSRWDELRDDEEAISMMPGTTAAAMLAGLGPNCWENLVACHVVINNNKGDMLPWDFGVVAEPWMPTWGELTIAGLKPEWIERLAKEKNCKRYED